MSRHLTAIVEREGGGYVALCPEVDVASQGDTVAAARDSLAEAVALFFQTAPAGEIDRCLRGEVYVTQIEVLRLAELRVLSGRGVRRIPAANGWLKSDGGAATSPCGRRTPTERARFLFRITGNSGPVR